MASTPGALAGLRAFTRLSGAERRAAVRAFGGLLFWRMALWALPWRIVAHRVSDAAPASGRRAAAWPAVVKRAVARASRAMDHPSCLAQALAGAGLLRAGGYPATLCIGVKRGGDRALAAHAWVECEGRVVAGEVEALDTYRELLRIDDRTRPPVR